MATAVMPKPHVRKVAEPAPKGKKRARIDNQRTEDIGRFALVLMMPIVLAALVLAIAFWATPALQ